MTDSDDEFEKFLQEVIVVK